MVEDEQVVETAADAAQGFIFSQLRNSDVKDLDITVTFEDGMLEIDVYLHAPEADVDVEQVADDAALTAQAAVDELFENESAA